jgi:hypothetical protein
MQIFITLAALVGLIGIPVGLLFCCFVSTRQIGKSIAIFSALPFVAAWEFADQANLSSSPHYQSNENKPALVSTLRITNIHLDTTMFGTISNIAKVSFMLYNDNSVPVKDIVVRCVFSRPSGTVLNRRSETIHRHIDAKSGILVAGLDMSFIHSKATRFGCEVTDFSNV